MISSLMSPPSLLKTCVKTYKVICLETFFRQPTIALDQNNFFLEGNLSLFNNQKPDHDQYRASLKIVNQSN